MENIMIYTSNCFMSIFITMNQKIKILKIDIPVVLRQSFSIESKKPMFLGNFLTKQH